MSLAPPGCNIPSQTRYIYKGCSMHGRASDVTEHTNVLQEVTSWPPVSLSWGPGFLAQQADPVSCTVQLERAVILNPLHLSPAAHTPHPFCPQCSRSCEGGYRVREVRCLADDMTQSAGCDPALIPEEREECNTHPCVPEYGTPTLTLSS